MLIKSKYKFSREEILGLNFEEICRLRRNGILSYEDTNEKFLKEWFRDIPIRQDTTVSEVFYPSGLKIGITPYKDFYIECDREDVNNK